MRIVAQNLTVRKLEKAADERIGPFGRYVYAILRNRFELRIRRGRVVPVQLHTYAARPLNHGVSSDGIVKRADQHVCAVCLRSFHAPVEVRNQITGTLGTERIRNRSHKPEYGHST